MIDRKTCLRVLLPLSTLLIVGLFVLARLMWPGTGRTFDDLWDTVSRLGEKRLNPIGCHLFQAALAMMGVQVLLTASCIHAHLARRENGKLEKAVMLFLLVGAAGFLLAGLVPSDASPVEKYHEILSGVGAAGVALFALFHTILPKEGDRRLRLATGALWGIPLLILATAHGYAEVVLKPHYEKMGIHLGWYDGVWSANHINPLLSFSLWERVLMGVIVVYQFLIVWSVPDRGPDATRPVPPA